MWYNLKTFPVFDGCVSRTCKIRTDVKLYFFSLEVIFSKMVLKVYGM